MDGEQVWIIFAVLFSGIVGWVVLCQRSLLKRQVTVADLLALVLMLGIWLGICSLFGVWRTGF